MSLEQDLNSMGFKIDSTSNSHRLLRADNSQAAFYSLNGTNSESGYLGAISDVSREEAVELGYNLALLILADEAARLSMPRFHRPTVRSDPYTNAPVVVPMDYTPYNPYSIVTPPPPEIYEVPILPDRKIVITLNGLPIGE